jgi:hypothetical protein
VSDIVAMLILVVAFAALGGLAWVCGVLQS